MSFRTLDDLDPAGRRVLVRVDLNVPTENGAVTDGTRLRRITPTLEELAAKGARVILLSHFGRPKGRDEKDSLAPVAQALGEVMGREIAFAADCTGPEATEAVAGLRDGGILSLENTRFHRGEEENDPDFVEALAALGDAYVNDAFSAAHRAHASTEGLARQLPAYAGRAMQRELEALDAALGNPKRPVLAIVGGSKVSTKLDLLVNLVGKVQMLVIGGGMANTFLHAKGVAIGRSLAERDLGGTARHILDTAARKGCEVILPVDAVVAATLAPDVATSTVPIEAVPADTMILDMGPLSAAAVNAAIDRAATLVWNGPLGAFETPPFEQATVVAARHAAERTAQGALVSVAGGGDTVAALAMAGVTDRITYLSTAGGAFLEWMEGKTLPGVAALG